MAKTSVDISLKNLDRARRYGIALSEACESAIEQRMRDALPIAELTPAAQDLLLDARREAERSGHETVRNEHIALAMLAGDSVPAQIMRRIGMTDTLRNALTEVMSSAGYNAGSNRVADKDGNPVGSMYLDKEGHPYVGDSEGKPVRVNLSPPDDKKAAHDAPGAETGKKEPGRETPG